jgi:hypothetical protein
MQLHACLREQKLELRAFHFHKRILCCVLLISECVVYVLENTIYKWMSIIYE